MAGKPIRLGKAAGELNVGISTLIEFLESKGVKIEVNPNTKLEPEHYEILQKEFAADQTLKEQSKFSGNKRERRETITLKDSKTENTQPEKEEEEEESEPINVEEIKRIVSEEPKKEEVVTVKPEREGDVKVQVVGKIDLDSLNTKTRPEKKEAEPAKAPEEKVVEEKAPEKEVVQPVAEEPVKEEIETIRVERQVLSGPTVLGKIELPVEKPKTSGKPGEDAASEARRKRKRIKKIDINTSGSGSGSDANKNVKKGAPRVDKPEITERDIQKEINYYNDEQDALLKQLNQKMELLKLCKVVVAIDLIAGFEAPTSVYASFQTNLANQAHQATYPDRAERTVGRRGASSLSDATRLESSLNVACGHGHLFAIALEFP